MTPTPRSFRSFEAMIEEAVLPLRREHPDWVQLDGPVRRSLEGGREEQHEGQHALGRRRREGVRQPAERLRPHCRKTSFRLTLRVAPTVVEPNGIEPSTS